MAVMLAGSLCQAKAVLPDDQPTDIADGQPTAFEALIARLGLTDAATDYSDVKKIVIDKPTLAYINITGTDKMPESKTKEQNVYMDIYTDDGNHFTKRAVISAQGNSSLAFPKKNFKADFCEDEWVGDETTSLTIGDWVKQDGFHFKSYYIDWLRGVGVVGYQLYDQMAQNTGRPWTRAADNISKPKDNARCYPDGFPCVVYLNGDFYGIFVWQLKKHRDNMNQTKTVAEHIHLDGTLGDDTFWEADSIDWTAFEVRNPKKLYTMDGKEYDGDNPRELIDEASESFTLTTDDDVTRESKDRTARVKQYILQLRQFYLQIQEMREAGATNAEIRVHIESRLDIQSALDYACFHLAVNNWDGFRKNWQWFTYDGNKWLVTPYDLDCIMGGWFEGTFTIPADRTYLSGGFAWSIPSGGPFRWLNTYYADDIKHRYCELRDARVIDADNIKGLLQNWHGSVSDYYADEWLRWPDSKCISETIVNDGWKLIDADYGKPAYNDTTIYNPGDRCTLDYLAWETTETVCGVKPYAQLGYRDSLERYEAWINRRIEVLDEHFDYRSTTTAITDQKRATADFTIYDAAGRKVSMPMHGLNIYRYADGRTRKIFK